MKRTNDLRIAAEVPLVSPAELARRYPMTDAASETIAKAREEVQNIIAHRDPRMLGIIGPCSIHDADAAIEYAQKVKKLSEKVSGAICLIMRVYFEKPRTALGWRGYIVDPMLDGSYDIAHGLAAARKLMLEINGLGVPVGSEMLDTIIPQYIAELVSWGAIGARTTESQTHREMSSGLSMPIGFKNATDGDVQIAVNAITASRSAHSFLGIDHTGSICVLRTTGNPDSHLILRGGRSGPNYHQGAIEKAVELMKASNIEPSIIIDCSHGNSNKDPENQPQVLRSIVDQRAAGGDASRSIIGFMIESNLEAGSQPMKDLKSLKRGVSITDACIDWATTEDVVLEAADRLRTINAR